MVTSDSTHDRQSHADPRNRMGPGRGWEVSLPWGGRGFVEDGYITWMYLTPGNCTPETPGGKFYMHFSVVRLQWSGTPVGPGCLSGPISQ